MRYYRVDECPECNGETIVPCNECGGKKHATCLECDGDGEIRKWVTLPEILAENGAVKMWAVYDEVLVAVDVMKITAWGKASILTGMTVKTMKAAGYTCEKVDVIRRKA